MGFMPDISKIIKNFDLGKHQTLLFSATFPKVILKIVNDFLRDPAIITVGSERAGATVDQEFMIVEYREKLKCLEGLIGTCDQRVLVFCDTKL